MASLLSWQSFQALGFVATLVGGAAALTQRFLPKQAPRKMTYVMLWLTFDALCHMIRESSDSRWIPFYRLTPLICARTPSKPVEASWLYLSTGGRTVNNSSSFFALLWQDYSKADQRWGWADPTVVSLEILTVLGAGPLAAYCAYLIHINDITYHYWVVVLSTAELYGGFVSFHVHLVRSLSHKADMTNLLRR